MLLANWGSNDADNAVILRTECHVEALQEERTTNMKQIQKRFSISWTKAMTCYCYHLLRLAHLYKQLLRTRHKAIRHTHTKNEQVKATCIIFIYFRNKMLFCWNGSSENCALSVWTITNTAYIMLTFFSWARLAGLLYGRIFNNNSA